MLRNIIEHIHCLNIIMCNIIAQYYYLQAALLEMPKRERERETLENMIKLLNCTLPIVIIKHVLLQIKTCQRILTIWQICSRQKNICDFSWE